MIILKGIGQVLLLAFFLVALGLMAAWAAGCELPPPPGP